MSPTWLVRPSTVDDVQAELKSLPRWSDLAHHALRYGWRRPVPSQNRASEQRCSCSLPRAVCAVTGQFSGFLRRVEAQSLIYLKASVPRANNQSFSYTESSDRVRSSPRSVQEP